MISHFSPGEPFRSLIHQCYPYACQYPLRVTNMVELPCALATCLSSNTSARKPLYPSLCLRLTAVFPRLVCRSFPSLSLIIQDIHSPRTVPCCYPTQQLQGGISGSRLPRTRTHSHAKSASRNWCQLIVSNPRGPKGTEQLRTSTHTVPQELALFAQIWAVSAFFQQSFSRWG